MINDNHRSIGDRLFVLDENREPVEVQDYAEWEAFANSPAATVGRESFQVVGATITVHTVFLGSDAGFDPEYDEAPAFYQTVVSFEHADGTSDGDDNHHYRTWAQAEAGHARLVRHYRDGEGPLYPQRVVEPKSADVLPLFSA